MNRVKEILNKIKNKDIEKITILPIENGGLDLRSVNTILNNIYVPNQGKGYLAVTGDNGQVSITEGGSGVPPGLEEQVKENTDNIETNKNNIAGNSLSISSNRELIEDNTRNIETNKNNIEGNSDRLTELENNPKIASTTTLGVIKVGDNLNITSEGVLSANDIPIVKEPETYRIGMVFTTDATEQRDIIGIADRPDGFFEIAKYNRQSGGYLDKDQYPKPDWLTMTPLGGTGGFFDATVASGRYTFGDVCILSQVGSETVVNGGGWIGIGYVDFHECVYRELLNISGKLVPGPVLSPPRLYGNNLSQSYGLIQDHTTERSIRFVDHYTQGELLAGITLLFPTLQQTLDSSIQYGYVTITRLGD